ncbi:Na+/H+ antiporter, partial [Peptoniphilus indolicus ATCC 29427]
MKNKIVMILYFIIMVGCIPIFFSGLSNLYRFITTLNYYILSPFSFPLLVSLPLVYKSRKLFLGYILLFPLAWNIFFIFTFLMIIVTLVL